MKLVKCGFIFIIISVVSAVSGLSVFADGMPENNASQAVQADVISDNSAMNDVSAKSAILVETSTGTIISEKNSRDKTSISHLAKLMTLLIIQEKIENGKLKLDDKVTVSANANSKGAPQIWLDVGETITVDELLKSITIGNANDACTALAEKIAGTEQDFVNLMNKKAKSLGMNDTNFTDCTGVDVKTVSTAYDLSLLTEELLKYEKLTPYLTTWMANVRNNAVELVSTNRLIRSYKGITGIKSCASKESGECLISSAKRGNMSVCAVVLGSSNDDSKFKEAKALMDYAFTSYEIYEPEIDEKALDKIKVVGGEQLNTKVKIDNLNNIVIPRGTYSQISCEFKRKESIKAPAKKNSKVGEIVFISGNEEILKCEIILPDEIRKNSFLFSLKRILLNLLKC